MYKFEKWKNFRTRTTTTISPKPIVKKNENVVLQNNGRALLTVENCSYGSK